MPRSNNTDGSYDNEAAHQVRMVIFGVIAIIFLIVFLIFLFGSWYTIDQGDRGVVLTLGKASQVISQPGLHFKIPIIQHVVVYSVRTQTIAFDNPANAATATPSEYDALSGASKDLQNVQIATIVNYHINEKDVLNIYQQYGDPHTYQVNILEPIIRNAMKATTAHFDAVDLVDNRSEVVKEATDMLTKEFAGKNAVLDNLNIVNFLYSVEFSQAIENKMVQVQNALAEQNKLEAVKYQAQQRVAQAQGESDAIRTQISAIAAQGGSNYLTMLWIQKWNGAVSLLNGGSPIVDLRGINAAGYVASNSISNTTG